MSTFQKLNNVKFFILIIGLTLLPQYITFSQTDDSTTTPTFASLSIGYSNITCPAYNNIYNDAVTWYQNQNISFNNLTRLGPSLIINGELYFATSPIVGVGIAYGYTFFTASADYKDNIGTIGLNAKVHNNKYLIITEINIVSFNDYAIYFRLKPGFFTSDFLFNEELKYNNTPNKNETVEFHVTGTGLCAESTIGISHSFGFMIVAFETGYNYSQVLSHSATITSPNNKSDGQLKMDIIQSGLFGLLSLGIEL